MATSPNESVSPGPAERESAAPLTRREGYLYLEDLPTSVRTVSKWIAEYFIAGGLWPTQPQVWREMHTRQIKAREVVQEGGQVFAHLNDSPEGDRFVQLRPWVLYDIGECRHVFEKAYGIYLDILKDLAVSDRIVRTREDVSRYLGVGASVREAHQVLWVLHSRWGGEWSEKEINSDWKAEFFVGILEHPTPDLESLFLSRPMGTRTARSASAITSVELFSVGASEAIANENELDARIRDRFQNFIKLGEGGYADVWRAEDTSLGRTVALKLVRRSAPSSHDALAHARALARVEHDNVVKVYEVTDVIDPATQEVTAAMIMEFVEGSSLSQRLKGEGFSMEEARHIGIGLLNALAAYHERDLAHTDLHEENVLLGPSHVKVLDPLFFETSTVRSTAALQNLQARDRRAARDLLVCIVRHTSACSLEAGAVFERTTIGANLLTLQDAFLTATGASGASPESPRAERERVGVAESETSWSMQYRIGDLPPREDQVLGLALREEISNGGPLDFAGFQADLDAGGRVAYRQLTLMALIVPILGNDSAQHKVSLQGLCTCSATDLVGAVLGWCDLMLTHMKRLHREAPRKKWTQMELATQSGLSLPKTLTALSFIQDVMNVFPTYILEAGVPTNVEIGSAVLDIKSLPEEAADLLNGRRRNGFPTPGPIGPRPRMSANARQMIKRIAVEFARSGRRDYRGWNISPDDDRGDDAFSEIEALSELEELQLVERAGHGYRLTKHGHEWVLENRSTPGS